MIKLLIDADSIVYSAAFMAQRKNEEGTMVLEPVQNAYHVIKLIMNNIIKELNKNKEQLNLEVYLTEVGIENNFRYKIDNTYKANRLKSQKPIYYDQCRNYLIKHYNAKIIKGEEAEDAVGIEAMNSEDKENTWIVGIDKDLNNIPGKHYNWKKKIKYNITPIEATRNFYIQLLVGDVADNIKGVNKIGPVKALKLLKNTETGKEMVNIVRDKYQNDKRLLSNGRLLWIRHKENELWELPE